jgi:hypothetical protein
MLEGASPTGTTSGRAHRATNQSEIHVHNVCVLIYFVDQEQL